MSPHKPRVSPSNSQKPVQKLTIGKVIWDLRTPLAIVIGIGGAFAWHACEEPDYSDEIKSTIPANETADERSKRIEGSKERARIIEEKRIDEKTLRIKEQALLERCVREKNCRIG